MKGSLDQSRPKEYPHLKQRAKQEQVRQGFTLYYSLHVFLSTCYTTLREYKPTLRLAVPYYVDGCYTIHRRLCG